MADLFPCVEYNCEPKAVIHSVCAKGMIVFVPNFTTGHYLDVIIYYRDKKWCRRFPVQCGSFLFVDWIPEQYINESEYSLIIEVKNNGEDVLIPYGTNCELVCGMELYFSKNIDCKHDYIITNCGEFKYKYLIDIKNCNWKIEIKNCKWTIKMANKIDFGGIVQDIPNPTIQVAGVTQINPAFTDYLNLLEPNAFVVTLVGGMVEVEYTGINNVEFWTNCGIVEKVCA